MGIKLRALKLEVFSKNNEKHEGYLEFKTSGLNIVRAENSMGKSTCVQSIIYALGLESMLVIKHEVPLPPAMKSIINVLKGEVEKELEVSRSYVYLEIENDNSDIVTIQRSVKSDQDIMLMKIYEGAILTKNKKVISNPLELYARLAGSAKNELGFYNWLKKFMAWDLPQVNLMRGSLTELYIESIVSLFIIEQKSGWTQIQANTPHFQIRDVKKRAIEFVLSLDAHKNYLKYQNLKREIENVESSWKEEYIKLNSSARSISGEIVGFSKLIPNSWGEEIQPNIVFQYSKKNYGIDDYLTMMGSLLVDSQTKYELKVEDLSAELKSTLSELEEKVYHLDTFVREHESKISNYNDEIRENNERIEEYKSELTYFKDIARLQKLGGTSSIKIDQSKCPTCSQEVSGTILKSDIEVLYMNLEENKDFLANELKTLEIINQNVVSKRGKLKLSLNKVVNELNDTRDKIRDIKDTLLESGKAPSKATFQEIIRYEKKIEDLKQLKVMFSISMSLFEDYYFQHQELTKKLSSMNEFLSAEDTKKLKMLNETIKKQLKKYGFNSFNLSELRISEDSYHPTLKDIDWYFDVSASDNVRGLWAYTLGLHKVIHSYDLNTQLGFVLFDEPKQHSAKGESFQSFLTECKSTNYGSVQKLVFTSEPEEGLTSFSNDKEVRYINYPIGARIIR